jgi:hypothetical protein
MSAIRLTGQLLPARLGGSESSAVHLLPAAIKHDGAAPVLDLHAVSPSFAALVSRVEVVSAKLLHEYPAPFARLRGR